MDERASVDAQNATEKRALRKRHQHTFGGGYCLVVEYNAFRSHVRATCGGGEEVVCTFSCLSGSFWFDIGMDGTLLFIRVPPD